MPTEQDMLWIRQDFHESRDVYPWLIVHGHSPVDAPTHYGNRVNLDAGAGYGKPLVVAVFDGRDCWLLDAAGRTPLVL